MFSGFSVDDIEKARAFYVDTLGLTVIDEMGELRVQQGDITVAFVYSKADHEPATYTTMNFVVSDIDTAVDALAAKGVVFERYSGFSQDEKGIMRGQSVNMGPDIAWFKDPAGNIFAVLQSS
jgi:catechol 2,3-dioxygenase-like lactoylglutathione lyase family enzyme